MMKTIFEHSQANILVIPQALFAMKDITVLKQHRNSAVLYKNLQHDLTDVEFYTNTPCFIYIDSGKEVITNSDNQVIELLPGQSILLPQGQNLHSDFVKQTERLKAYLVFFDDDVVTEFLSSRQAEQANRHGSGSASQSPDYCRLTKSDEIGRFFHSLQVDINDPAFLKVKLLELLHLIAWQAPGQQLHALLAQRKRLAPKRNLARILENPEVLKLSVSAMADLCGRSPSSFNRDFKALYQQTPKQWLQQKRLATALTLLQSGEQSVTDIALQLGYENVSGFIQAFKQQYGITPKQAAIKQQTAVNK